MSLIKSLKVSITFIFLAFSISAWAQNINTGFEKLKEKDYQGAFKEFMPLSNKKFGIEELRSQYMVYFMYSNKRIKASESEFLRICQMFEENHSQLIKNGLLTQADKDKLKGPRAEILTCIGRSLIFGSGSQKDKKRAFNVIKQSAELENSEGQFMLGIMYKEE